MSIPKSARDSVVVAFPEMGREGRGGELGRTDIHRFDGLFDERTDMQKKEFCSRGGAEDAEM